MYQLIVGSSAAENETLREDKEFKITEYDEARDYLTDIANKVPYDEASKYGGAICIYLYKDDELLCIIDSFEFDYNVLGNAVIVETHYGHKKLENSLNEHKERE